MASALIAGVRGNRRNMAGKPKFVESTPRPYIACCFAGCPECAICRIFTDTGWANVCLTHYPKIKPSKKSYCPENLTVKEARRAYEASPHYRARHGGVVAKTEERAALEAELAKVKERMAGFREPGSDDDLPLGIGLDALEEELADRINP